MFQVKVFNDMTEAAEHIKNLELILRVDPDSKIFDVEFVFVQLIEEGN